MTVLNLNDSIPHKSQDNISVKNFITPQTLGKRKSPQIPESEPTFSPNFPRRETNNITQTDGQTQPEYNSNTIKPASINDTEAILTATVKKIKRKQRKSQNLSTLEKDISKKKAEVKSASQALNRRVTLLFEQFMSTLPPELLKVPVQTIIDRHPEFETLLIQFKARLM